RLERYPWYARMADFLRKAVRPLLGQGAGYTGIFLLALESSLGEEALFRGFVQPWLARLLEVRATLAPSIATPLAVLLATAIFTCVHPPLHRDLRPWTVFAFLIGLAF